MKTIRFILAFAQLVVSPAILLLYGVSLGFATIGMRRDQLLDFSPQLG